MRKVLAAVAFLSVPCALFFVFFDVDWAAPNQADKTRPTEQVQDLASLVHSLQSDNVKLRLRGFTRGIEMAQREGPDAALSLQTILDHIPKESSEEFRYRFFTRLPREWVSGQPYLQLCEQLLKDESKRIQFVAARELAMQGHSLERVFNLAAAHLTSDEKECVGPALGVLGHAGKHNSKLREQARQLIDPELSNPSPQIRVDALFARFCLDRSSETLRDCLHLLEDDTPSVRCAAIMQFRSEAPQNSVIRSAILKRLADDDGYVQAEAIRALARCKECDAEMRQAFLAALKTRYAFARGLAIEIAPRFNDRILDQRVLEAQKDADWFCRWKLVYGLRDMAASETEKRAVLAKLRQDSDITVQQTAQTALEKGWYKARPK